MKRLSAIMIFAGAVLVSTHILAPASPPPATSQPIAGRLAAIAESRPAVDRVNAQVDRLRKRLASPPAYPPPRRDPFRFGARPEPPRRKPAPAPAPAAAPAAEAAAASVPPLPHVVAIATNVVDGQLVRTAVLANGDDVVVVKPGDACAGLTVRTIGVDAVELADPATGRTIRISLQ